MKRPRQHGITTAWYRTRICFYLEVGTFAIDNELDLLSKYEAQLGLDGEEGELDQEPKPV